MHARIVPIRTGFTTSYLLIGKKAVLLDAGIPGSRGVFLRSFDTEGIEPRDISLIVVTHGHWDHVGSLADLAEAGGCPVLAAGADAALVGSGEMVLPDALTPWGRMVRAMLKHGLIRRKAFRPRAVDIVLDEPAMELGSFGIEGTVIRTPGHTTGSLSVLTATGEALVGDLAAGGFPYRFGNGPMVLGDSTRVMKESLDMLIRRGARVVFPGHGRAFTP
jgi:glyoxylase-like metal-dependent hydrolase (beta-lactamase superfamily II)